MRNQAGITKRGVIVIIAVLILIVALVNQIAHRIRHIASRVTCGTYLKGLGTSMQVYAQDYDDKFPQLPGKGPWSKTLGFSYDMGDPDFSTGGAQEFAPRTITASWYLLVKYADTNPKQFVCPRSTQTTFVGDDSPDKDIVKLWDFGPDPYKHISYSMQNPYGKFPANANQSALFPIAADMNPWFQDGNILSPATGKKAPQIITVTNSETFKLGNTKDHAEKGTRWGQNVAFSDGHCEYAKVPNIGINDDNIYTYWSTDEEPTAQDIQGGVNPTARDEENDSKSEEDSFLAL